MENPSFPRFAEVLLPRPLAGGFTYIIPENMHTLLRPGIRVLVQFGNRKIYSGIILRLHNEKPENHQPKAILEVLGPAIDDQRILQFWEWLASYYMCTPGEVMNVALPSRLKLESETQLLCPLDEEQWPDTLSDTELEVLRITRSNSETTLNDVIKFSGASSVKVVRHLVDSGLLLIKESIKHQSLEKWIKVVRLRPNSEELIAAILSPNTRAKSQQNLLLAYYQLESTGQPITREKLLDVSRASMSSLDALVEKGIFEIVEVKESSIIGRSGMQAYTLTPVQNQALQQILDSIQKKRIVLLHGVTSSGKTEIYVHLMKQVQQSGGQCLLLVPEIALTTQLIGRLRQFFGDQISLYHSRMSDREQTDVWESVRKCEPTGRIVVGARSALFLPYSDLRLVIIDEEHDPSYRQDAPNPRYQGRDAAIYLASLFDARVLLGSATPSIESYFNTQIGKYDLVELHQRYEGLSLPTVEIVDLRAARKKGQLRGNFSQALLLAIEQAIARGRQSIIFQNRRGYAPRLVCTECGLIHMCQHCDIALTLHKAAHKLRCHYCGSEKPVPLACSACGSVQLQLQGAGTEQIEDELTTYFPNARIERLDLDTARSKKRYQQLLTDMETGQIDILVGTQMVTKGLNFANVEVVGVVNADNLLYFPEYRAHERAFQLLEQVAGRSGRSGQVGKVFIQTYTPQHPVLTHVSTHHYGDFYQWQAAERREFHYPPFVRMIQLTLRHRDLKILQAAASQLAQSLTTLQEIHIIGPEFPPVARVSDYYRMRFLIKIPKNQSYLRIKNTLWHTCLSFFAHADYRRIRYTFEVDI
ncbi:replication restart helicase PriA [Thermaurantimonas aggregans]|uniref:replication restart helicase PriA n=1 Tax=Thermaurantimonas aggregans TaxID=2173829 RepID=UPI0023F19E56|nr:primosomal protein N' [Thermaurantimonas aggregans]MCX8148873.1 primosomal protein N' [Thermaurantimonas aggregans]